MCVLDSERSTREWMHERRAQGRMHEGCTDEGPKGKSESTTLTDTPKQSTSTAAIRISRTICARWGRCVPCQRIRRARLLLRPPPAPHPSNQQAPEALHHSHRRRKETALSQPLRRANASRACARRRCAEARPRRKAGRRWWTWRR